jgi:hypothetical protein
MAMLIVLTLVLAIIFCFLSLVNQIGVPVLSQTLSFSFLAIQKMVNGGRVRSWICVNFARNVQESVASGFCRELARMCQASGMASIP